ncbi:MAG: type II toxin-antitoxin system HicB family antitoxin [Candidatus Bipolaricaulia bacterium]
MTKARAVALEKKSVKSYTFRVVIEPDPFEDGRMAYHACVPLLEEKGAATFGYTVEEALANLQEVVRMVLQSMKRHHEPIPEEPEAEVKISSEPAVTVTLME